VETLMFSLENQKPDHIGFIFSIVSESYVNDLITKMRLEEDRCKKKVVDAGNVVEIRSDTKLLIEWMRANGLTNRDIVVDVTGGMTTMSVGAFSMAEEMNIDTQYITSDYDDKNRPIRGTERGVFVKRYSRGN
jgi:S-adenosylmethionine synthetase